MLLWLITTYEKPLPLITTLLKLDSVVYYNNIQLHRAKRLFETPHRAIPPLQTVSVKGEVLVIILPPSITIIYH